MIVECKWFPFKRFCAINLFGLIIKRADCILGEQGVRHEQIHTAQMKEMLYIFFYIWYAIEWLLNLLNYWSFRKAYYNIRFEKEAFFYESEIDYLRKRPSYNWLRTKYTIIDES